MNEAGLVLGRFTETDVGTTCLVILEVGAGGDLDVTVVGGEVFAFGSLGALATFGPFGSLTGFSFFSGFGSDTTGIFFSFGFFSGALVF